MKNVKTGAVDREKLYKTMKTLGSKVVKKYLLVHLKSQDSVAVLNKYCEGLVEVWASFIVSFPLIACEPDIARSCLNEGTFNQLREIL